MSYIMMCVIPTIYLNDGVRITQKGQQFEIEDKATRDLLIENKNAIDITDGIPASKATDKDILLVNLDLEKQKVEKLAKELAELRQQLKNNNNSDEEELIIEKAKAKTGGK